MGYYIGVDYRGQPYIAHVGGYGGQAKERANHKYIARIDTPDGYRYFYTEKELEAYYNKLQKEVNNNRKIYEDQKGKIKVSKNGGKSHYYKSVDELSDLQKKKYKNSIQEMPERDAKREAWLNKYEAQLDEHNKSKKGK